MATSSRALRLEEHQATHKRMRGAGTVAGLGCGQTFSLTNYPRKDQNDKYLVLAVEHEIWADAYRSNSSGGEEEPYLCTIEVQPSAVPFRPPLVTPKPIMPGPETAIVTGPDGEEIWTDKYGRVKVQFPGTGWASTTRTARAGCACRRPGRAPASAASTSRASARR